MDAVLGIHAAVNHPYPEHRVSVKEALRMFTIDGAYSAFEEDKKGSLEKGKLGDLTILESSPYEVPQDQIRDIPVEMTVKEGRIVYQREEK
jgi:predicted amidohydrolase YtcJ